VTRNPKIEIGAVEAAGPGTLFALTGKNKAGKKFAKLVHLAAVGTTTKRGDLRAFEKNNNPDHGCRRARWRPTRFLRRC
jgi:hypothetical protein